MDILTAVLILAVAQIAGLAVIGYTHYRAIRLLGNLRVANGTEEAKRIIEWADSPSTEKEHRARLTKAREQQHKPEEELMPHQFSADTIRSLANAQ
jgi:hypothetical protein